jgi:hypothetical protein
MSEDRTEGIRRVLAEAINSGDLTKDEVAKLGDGGAWTTDELTRDFEVLGFMAPFVVVRRRSDGVRGTLTFRHSPRIYFDWSPDR